MLTVRGVDVYYGESRILSRVDLTVGDGQVVCVMGRNGVGKTTLLKTVDEVAEVLQRINREGPRSIVVVEQHLECARAICDRFYVMDKGVVALEGERQTFDVNAVSALLSV